MNEPSWDIEVEPEVRHWLDNLSDSDYLTAEHAAERLADHPTELGEPYARHLGDGLRELRFTIGHNSSRMRITYWLAPGRRIVLLTVFRKTRMREHSEVERAHQAMKACHAEHPPAGAHDMFTRDVQKGKGQ